MFKKVIKAILQYAYPVLGNFILILNKKKKRQVVISSVGRSGSTWLAELINYNGYFRYLFEPFWREKTKFLRMYSLRHYLRINEKDDGYIKQAKRILEGKFCNYWSEKNIKKILGSNILIKDIRINLFLGWLKNNFPNIKIIFLIRHPCAVAVSRLNQGWDVNLKKLYLKDDLIEDYLKEKMILIENAESFFEKAVIQWCIEFIVPISQLKPGQYLTVFYEDLVVSPEYELKRIFDYLQLSWDKEVLKKVRIPSKTSFNKTNNIDMKVLTGWKQKCSHEDIKKFNEILEIFGINSLYNDSIYPNKKAFKNIIESVHNYRDE